MLVNNAEKETLCMHSLHWPTGSKKNFIIMPLNFSLALGLILAGQIVGPWWVVTVENVSRECNWGLLVAINTASQWPANSLFITSIVQ